MYAPIPRRPWPVGFPDVVVHAALGLRDAHPGYRAAKAGDADAAIRLAEDLISEPGLEQLRHLIGPRHPIVVPVAAIEAAGFNAIPDAMAHVIGRLIGLAIETHSVVQANRVNHTRAGAALRLVTPPRFVGDVVADADYLIVDDHVGLGGTLANLRGMIESRGARVVAMSTLTESRDSRAIALRHGTVRALRDKHGPGLELLWRECFGYGLDELTEPEAGYLLRGPSLDAIRNRLVAAAAEARRHGFSAPEFPAG